MEIRQLPNRIVKLMMGTILVFVLTLSATVLWLTRALDQEAHENSLAQVRVALDNLLAQADAMNLDYAKWDEAAIHVFQADTEWLFDSIGIAATIGEALQLVVIWGGPYQEDIGWTDDGIVEARSGLLDDDTISEVERFLSGVPLRSYDGVPPFFVWSDETLYALAAARIERGLDRSAPRRADTELARLAQGHRLDDEQIGAIAKSTLLSGVGVSREVPVGLDFLPLNGASGEPIAYMSWMPPRPGTMLLYKLLPFLGVIIVGAILMVLRGLALVRRNAQYLVAAEREASSAARTDALTGLPNRAAFNELLALPANPQERAILFLDVNDFKRINDSIGHAAGDEVIICVAKRLTELTSPNCILARIAGDEFVFVISGEGAEARTKSLAERSQAALARHFIVLGHQMQVKMAMGYAIQLDSTTAGSDLVRQADLAMYEAKRLKSDGPIAFNAMIERATRDALAIEKGIRQALRRPGEISIAYQPIINPDGTLARAEALARWTSADLGSVPPDRFIAVAEQAGLIVELGRQLWRLVCEDLARYPELRVSVNVSPLQLMAPDFIPSLVAELTDRAIDPTRIEIELTESVVVDDPRLAGERIEELRSAGFSIALDDFGTGYSSVGYLGKFHFDTLKIDRSFVSRIRTSDQGIRVVDGIIRMAHGFELSVVCEGIESSDDFETLCHLGCDFAQGFHIGPPVSIAGLATQWLAPPLTKVAVA